MPSIQDIESQARDLHALGRAAWPTFDVSEQAFVRFVIDRLRDIDREKGLAGLHARDLYLARACAAGDPRAIATFETLYQGDIQTTLTRLRLPPHEVAELEQLVRIRLFVDGPKRAGKIAEYAGRGALQAWLRTVAVRVALSSLRSNRETSVGSADKIEEFLAASVMDAETSYLKQHYGDAFNRALSAAVASLVPKERLVLEQYFFDDLTIDQLAALHGGHRTTIARTLRRVCAQLMQRTKESLAAGLDLSDERIESLLQLVLSRMDVVLVEAEGGAP